MTAPKPKRAQPAPASPMVWERADPAALAQFDPATKACSMNCGPHSLDPRSRQERLFLCDDCYCHAAPSQPKGTLAMTKQLEPLIEDRPDVAALQAAIEAATQVALRPFLGQTLTTKNTPGMHDAVFEAIWPCLIGGAGHSPQSCRVPGCRLGPGP